MEALFGFLLIVFAVFIYFLPSYIANKRGHHNTMPIVIINVFLGWMVLFWFIALIWSTTAVKN